MPTSTDWEQLYLEANTPWDKGEPAPGLADYLRGHDVEGRILVPGCGLGHDVRALAGAAPQSEVIGLDVAPSAVKAARKFTPMGRECYVEGDLFDPPVEWDGTFDWIWEHTCFCAIDPDMRDTYEASIWKLLKPGGRLLAVFYLDPYDDEHQPGEGPPHGVSLDELEDRFGTRFVLESSWKPERAYEGREGREVMMIWRKCEGEGL